MKKTDDSVKAGLEIRADHHDAPDKKSPAPAPENNPIDADEKVHEQHSPEINSNEEQDYDDVVHQMPTGRDSTDDEDLDDKVHRTDENDDADRR